MTTTEELKSTALRLSENSDGNEVSYAELQKALNKMPLKDLDALVKELIAADPDFAELDDKGTAKKSDDVLVIKSSESKVSTKQETKPKAEKPKKEAKAKEKKTEKPKKEKKVKVAKDGPPTFIDRFRAFLKK